MKKVFPDYIKQAAVISPAGYPDEAELSAGAALLERNGIKVNIMPHAIGCRSKEFPYLAASDQERADDFMRAYCDRGNDIIIASRGGYGCGRMLDLIDWDMLKQYPDKIVAGYSDLTSLFLAMTSRKCGTPLASVMTAKLPECGKFEFQHLADALCRRKRSFKLEVIKNGSASGNILAGNLTVFASCIGTEYFPDVKGKVLFLEEVGEDPYRIDRLLNQLHLSGVLAKCSAVVFGHLSGCRREDVLPILQHYSKYVNGPVLNGFAYGHELPFAALKYGDTAAICGENAVIC